jgi:hypothetical protein
MSMSDPVASLQEKIPPVALLLGLVGTVPFIAAAIGCWVDPELARRGMWLPAGLAYGAAILSFLGGIRWGASLGSHQHQPQFTLSVLPCLAGWAALLVPGIIGICMLIGGFLLQALWDVTGVQTGRLPPWFGRLRMWSTAIVISALLAMLGKLAL